MRLSDRTLTTTKWTMRYFGKNGDQRFSFTRTNCPTQKTENGGEVGKLVGEASAVIGLEVRPFHIGVHWGQIRYVIIGHPYEVLCSYAHVDVLFSRLANCLLRFRWLVVTARDGQRIVEELQVGR